MPKNTEKAEEKSKNDKKKSVKVVSKDDDSDDEHLTKNNKSTKSEKENKTDKSKNDKSTKSEKDEKTDKSSKSKNDKTDKSDKSDKSTKQNKSSENESGEKAHPNEETKKAGTFFNVKATKQWLQEYYSDYSVAVVSKDENGNKKTSHGKVKFTFGAHWCLTVVDQIVCSTVINASSKRALKGVDGFYTVTEQNVRDAVEGDSELRFMYGRFMPLYDRKNKYTQSMKLNAKDLSNYIEKHCINGNTAYLVESSATNLVVFLMYESRKLLAESAYQMCQYAAKSSVNDRAFLCSVVSMFPEGNLQKSLYAKVDEVAHKARGVEMEKKQLSEDSNKKDTKSSKDKKDTKKTDKKNKKDESDNESESEASDNESENEESDNDSESDSNDGSDDE